MSITSVPFVIEFKRVTVTLNDIVLLANGVKFRSSIAEAELGRLIIWSEGSLAVKRAEIEP
jgi:hypothetical protein